MKPERLISLEFS